MVIGALVSGYAITGSNAYCARTCHVNEESVIQATALNHAKCVSCHERPGLASMSGNIPGRASMVVSRLRRTTPQGALVDSRACLRCHCGVVQGVATTNGIKMSHVEPLNAGLSCSGCHQKAGHGSSRLNSMSPCIVCHDGKSASSDCLTCHVTQPLASPVKAGSGGRGLASASATLGSGSVVYPLVDIDPNQCGKCHDQARQCDTCHGLRMPHSGQFIHGGHAPLAAFERKQACWRCHQLTECYRCHGPFTAHPSDWKQSHKTNPWDAGCACHVKDGSPAQLCFPMS